MDKLAQTNRRPVTMTSGSVSEGHPDNVCDFIAGLPWEIAHTQS